MSDTPDQATLPSYEASQRETQEADDNIPLHLIVVRTSSLHPPPPYRVVQIREVETVLDMPPTRPYVAPPHHSSNYHRSSPDRSRQYLVALFCAIVLIIIILPLIIAATYRCTTCR